MASHRLAPKETAQQRKCVVCQCLVDERMLALQRLSGATTGLLIVIERRIDDLGEQLRNGAKPVGLMPVVPIERLSEDELARVRVVAEIEPVGDAAPRGRECVMYLGSGSAAVDATDDEIKIVVQVVTGAQMLRDSLPMESPEQVHPVDQNDRFEEPNLARGERLADAVRGRDPVTIDHGHRQARRMPARDERLVKMRQPANNRAARSPATDNRHFDGPPKQMRETGYLLDSPDPNL